MNSIRAIFARWHDRLSAAALLLIALLFLRVWLAERPWMIAAATVFGACFVIGALVGRALASRLAFHAFDGVLAADALQARIRWRYVIAWQTMGLAALIAVALIVRPLSSFEALAGYVGGAFVGHLTADLGWQWLLNERRRFGWLWPWLRRPSAGLAGGLVLLLSLSLEVRRAGAEDLAIVAGLETAFIVIALSTLNQGVIRFMAVTGRGSFAIVWHHARGTLLFLGFGVPACLLVTGPAPGVAVLAISALALLVMTMRILTYQFSPKRVADLVVSVLAAILMAAAFYAPVLLPFLTVAILWRLGRRASNMTWLLA